MRVSGRRFLGGLGLYLVSALATGPISATVYYSIGRGFEGWTGDPVSQIVGWAVLSLPTVVVLGAPIALLYIWFDARLNRRRWSTRFLLLTVGSSLVFGLALSAPNNIDLNAILTVVVAYAALWTVFGLLVRWQWTAVAPVEAASDFGHSTR